MADRRIKTGISKIYWPGVQGGDYKFLEAMIDGENLSWFDELFKGGIHIPNNPEDKPRAITLLLSGPPGSGKSTLATELCYRVAKQYATKSLYFSTESPSNWLIENASTMWGKDEVQSHFSSNNDEKQNEVTVFGIGDVNEKGDSNVTWVQRFLGLNSPNGASSDSKLKLDPATDIFVVDSLNSVDISKRNDVLDQFSDFVNGGPKLAILVLDSFNENEISHVWEYRCDIVVRMNRTYPVLPSEYMIRTIEVLKARYQEHVLGPHQIKIYSNDEIKSANPEILEDVKDVNSRHPYRVDGGIFIYPSIHYLLSKYRRSIDNLSTKRMPCALEEMTSLIEGFPKGGCTALLGMRGGHKSHLGLVQILHQLDLSADNPERSIVVTLRDDESTTKALMENIQSHRNGKTTIDELLQHNRLEILQYQPGYITAEEFIHRILLSIHRMRETTSSLVHVNLLFNSLDQLRARFPLCADQNIFIAGMIQIFSGMGVTSYFCAAKDDEETDGYYGVDSIAELVLEFSEQTPSAGRHLENINRINKQNRKTDYSGSVVVKVIRYAGAQASGECGLLSLCDGPNGETSDGSSSRLGLKYEPIKER